MQIIHSIADLAPLHGAHLVPTMGALHEGHDALIRAALASGDETPVAVSIFVNPTQFNDPADFHAYPRTLETDAKRCRALGVDAILAPDPEDVYTPHEKQRPIDLPPVATEPGLEDRFRPGHFEGVARVCRRLFELTRPARAFFGEKDWQQLQLVCALTEDPANDLDLEIIPVPTVRDHDALALSSRNVHLAPEDRRRAAAIPRALARASGENTPAGARAAALAVLEDAGIEPEYVAIRDAQTLLEPRQDHPARILIAARIGPTRLIDNAPWPGFAI